MQQLEKKQIPSQTVVCIEHSGAHNEIGKVYRELNAWAKKNGVKPSEAGFTIFLDPPNEFDPHSGRFEVCMPVAAAPRPDDKVRVKRLPALTVASSRVKGSYEKIPAHYTEMLAWITAQGWELAGAPREVYLTRPTGKGEDSPDNYLTEIQFPVEP